MFIFGRFFKAIKDALRGIKEAFVEQSFRTLFIIGFLVIVSLFIFPFAPVERAVLILVVALVLSLELINSQIERILDVLHPDYSEKVRKIKDISAGAVLVASISSVFIGFVIILPYLLEKFSELL